MKHYLLSYLLCLAALFPFMQRAKAQASAFAPVAGQCYRFSLCGAADVCIYEAADGSLLSAAYDPSLRCFWEFEASENAGFYYIRNASSGNYIQSSALSVSAPMSTGPQPVEFYIGKDTNSGSTNGFLYFSSTDNDGYASNATDGALGLNRSGSSASSTIVAYYVKTSRKNSYWNLIETENLYESHPFVSSDRLGDAQYAYAMKTLSGSFWGLDEALNPALASSNADPGTSWYFVGESNATGGYVISNAQYPGRSLAWQDGAFVLADMETPQRWLLTDYSGAAQQAYYFRPADAAIDSLAGPLTVNGDSLLTFAVVHSTFARQAQIYLMPCGVLGDQYITALDMEGDAVLRPMNYPHRSLSGSNISQATAAPTSWYTIYTHDKARLARGEKFNLQVTLNAAPLEGTDLYVYFDWDADGVFETTYQPALAGAQAAVEVTVPAEAALKNSRMRFRLTENGLSDADDDAAGQVLDCIITVADDTNDYTVTVAANAPSRGVAALSEEGTTFARGTTLSASATALEEATFLCWLNEREVVSLEPTYTFEVEGDTHLKACFTPETDDPVVTGIADGTVWSDSRELITVTGGNQSIEIQTEAAQVVTRLYSVDGALLLTTQEKRIATAGLPKGTIIVRVQASEATAGAKVVIK